MMHAKRYVSSLHKATSPLLQIHCCKKQKATYSTVFSMIGPAHASTQATGIRPFRFASAMNKWHTSEKLEWFSLWYFFANVISPGATLPAKRYHHQKDTPSRRYRVSNHAHLPHRSANPHHTHQRLCIAIALQHALHNARIPKEALFTYP